MSSKQGNIGVTSENIFPIIKKFLYSDHEIFLRELVSNAVDATQKLKTLSFSSFSVQYYPPSWRLLFTVIYYIAWNKNICIPYQKPLRWPIL